MAPGVVSCVTGAIRVTSCVVFLIGVVAVGVGVWTIYRGEGPLVEYLKTEEERQAQQDVGQSLFETMDSKPSAATEAEVTIQIMGGLLIGAGCVLIIDFILGMFASTKMLAGCCVPSFLAFALVTCLIFAGCGVAALTVLEPSLRTALSAVFEKELESKMLGLSGEDGPLARAEKEFDCCGPEKCTDYGITSDKYLRIQQYCIACSAKPGCVDAVLDNTIKAYGMAFAIGCFSVAGMTTLLVLFSLILCCCRE